MALRDCIRLNCETIIYFRERIEESEPKYVLDLGYGEGHMISYFLENGYDVLGIDKKEGIKQKLENALDEAKIPWKGKLDLREQDVAEFDPGDQKFSCIIASYVLHFLEYPQTQALVEKLKNALAPRGIILIKVHHASHPARRTEKGRAYIKYFFTKGEIKSFFKEGFEMLLEGKGYCVPMREQEKDGEPAAVFLEYVFQKQ